MKKHNKYEYGGLCGCGQFTIVDNQDWKSRQLPKCVKCGLSLTKKTRRIVKKSYEDYNRNLKPYARYELNDMLAKSNNPKDITAITKEIARRERNANPKQSKWSYFVDILSSPDIGQKEKKIHIGYFRRKNYGE